MKKRKKTNQCFNLREAMRKIKTRGNTNTFSLNIIKMQVFSNTTWSSSSKASPCSMSSLLACKFSRKLSSTQAQYLEELKAVKTRQDELWNNTNKFHHQIRKEQDMLAREIQEVKKYQVNQTLMSNQKGSMKKLEQSMVLQQKEMAEIKKQFKDWTRIDHALNIT
ncbi:hypothetical protein PIB30_094188 [Stylosanthes scabra]|uniref:Uncharacterized protein n=1 Tax=Stylosanthes scabra TaxID=79078 RepID=A0ABU6VZ47_9FABA|nr:hypothetical protein [Stylosanthes scabra]